MNLIQEYAEGKISRAEFCRAYAESQGFDNTVRSYGDIKGLYIEYRGRRGTIRNNHISWIDGGKLYTARTIKELKIKIDVIEMRRPA